MAAEKRVTQLIKRYDAIEATLRRLQHTLAAATRHVDVVAPVARIATAPVEHSTFVPAGGEPKEVTDLRQFCATRHLNSARFLWVPSDYYQHNLQWRRDTLQAPSIQHLCKTILMENTHCIHDDCSMVDNSRYYLVVYPYTQRFDSDLLARVIQQRNDGIGKKKFNFRLAESGKALTLTGVRSGAVAPFGTPTAIPVILSSSIAALSPPVFYAGGGHVDCKCFLDVAEFIDVMKPIIASITVPLSEEELLNIAD